MLSKIHTKKETIVELPIHVKDNWSANARNPLFSRALRRISQKRQWSWKSGSGRLTDTIFSRGSAGCRWCWQGRGRGCPRWVRHRGRDLRV